MSRKPTKAEEGRLRGLATMLEYQREDAVERVEQIRFAWVRRTVVEGRYTDASRGEVREPMSVYDLWLEDVPGEPPREPEAHASSAREALRDSSSTSARSGSPDDVGSPATTKAARRRCHAPGPAQEA